jgi:cyclopropane-fatty-acyl-phospholipid synthase
MVAALGGIREGHLVLRTPEGRLAFGDPASPLKAEVELRDPRAWAAGAFQGEVGLGEAYMAGWWTSPDPVAVVRLAVRSMAAFDRAGGFLAFLGKLANRLRHLARRNDEAGSRANIAHHYDLGNAFYRLWLDESLAYSCAYWRDPSESLHQAQVNKFEKICDKLRLGPEDHLLEIGTGWGGFAAHAARTRGCRITTTTISKEQHDHAAALFSEQGLGNLVDLRLQDYRRLEGTYTKAVSIEMFEAVGLGYYDAFFGAVDRLLAPGGAFLMQAITMNERCFPDDIRGTDWIQKHIFPGAELASVGEILKSLARTGTLQLHHLEDIGLHYARTLREWRRAFLAWVDEVRALGFDETFLRMWNYYLAYCEGAFLERHIGDAQLLLVKPGAGPLANETGLAL